MLAVLCNQRSFEYWEMLVRLEKGLVARQHPIDVGEVVGNDYVVKNGVKPGDRLIVGGIQKIGDGAPVKPE